MKNRPAVHSKVHPPAKTATTVALARAVLDFGGRTVAAHQLARAQSLLLDAIGCAILGSHEPTARAMMAAAETSTGPCVVIGRGDHTTVAAAVLANGAAIRVLDFNDYFIGEANGQPEAGGHPSDNIPVALAVAQARGSTGQQLLASIILGYELYWRLQCLMDRAGKWDGVSASGIVAPAIAGFLIGLDEQRLAHAIALGAARAATPSIIRRGGIAAAKSIANAMVAQSGVQAALLAEAGITGPLNILDDPRGLQELFRSPDLLPLTRPISGNATMAAQVKFFPCVNTAQTAVAAAAEVRKAMKHQINEIRAVEIVMADYPMVKRQQEDAQRRSPSSREAADHSLPFLVAVTLIDGALTLVQFADERWRDPAVKCLMEKISMRRDAEWNQRAPGALPCTLRVIANDAREYRAESIHPPQVTLQSVTAKFHGILADVVPYGVRARIVDAVMELHHSPSTAALDAALTNGEAN